MKYQYLILLLFIKQIFSEYCGIDNYCSSCQYCNSEVENNCSCSFYSNFCFNQSFGIYSFNSSLLYRYDICFSSSKNNLERDICGKSSFDNEIGKDNFYQFFSFHNPEYLNDNNIFCQYLFTSENEDLKEDLIFEIDVKMKKETLNENLDNKNLILIFAEDFNSKIKTLYSLNLHKITDRKYTIKAPQYKSISLYISLIKNNGFLNNNELIYINLGFLKDSSYVDRIRRYKALIIIICIIFIVCIASCLIIFLIKYKRDRDLYRLRANEMADNNGNLNIRLSPGEKKKKLIKLFDTKLKMRKYLKKDNINVTTACSICLEEFIENKSEVSITPCMHIFHYKCLHNWLFMENSKCLCPYCNNNLLSDKPPAKRHIVKEKKIINEKTDILDKLGNNKKRNQENLNSSERDMRIYNKDKKSNTISKGNNNENNNINNNLDNKEEININEDYKEDENEVNYNITNNNENIQENKNKENYNIENNENNNINYNNNENNNNEENQNNIINENIKL